ncbi:GH12 family glycosyl hydrolase domain-containing protein [Faecalibacter macacae]|nr:hypothetical protein [Faecalibacter macacae]
MKPEDNYIEINKNSWKNILIIFVLLASPLLLFAQRIEKHNSGEIINWKEFEINNNKWGTYKIKKGTYDQSIFLENDMPGWRWKTPGKSYGVLGYPMIFLGTSAWYKLNEIKSDNYFKNLEEIKSFNVDYKTDLKVDDKKYNLAFDFWLHNSPKVAFETIGAEVMIWEDYNKFKPFGKKQGKLTTSNGQYEVYTGKIFKKELNKGWDYIAFVRLNKRRSGKLILMEFINYMKEHNLYKNNSYLSSFEFGTEILTSTGEIKILQYEVEIK